MITGRLIRSFAEKSTPAFKFKERYSEFVYQSLYNSQVGYFRNPKNIQLGRLDQPIDFASLLGFDGYTKVLSERYPEHRFLTPCEIFRPYYGMTIAKMLVEKARAMKMDRLNVIEVGSGLGGNSDSFLAYLKNSEPSFYSTISYTLVEISETLIQSSKRILAEGHRGLIKNGGLKFVNRDANNFDLKSEEPHFILMFEVLDNLPHDKIIAGPDLTDPNDVWILSSEDRETRQEQLQPLKDETTALLLNMWKDLYFKNGKVEYDLQIQEFSKLSLTNLLLKFNRKFRTKQYGIYLPTTLYKMVSKLRAQLPKAEFVMSDFSTLPSLSPTDGVLEINRPIISRKLARSEESQDYQSVLDSEFGSVDIFFPSDFDLVKRVLEKFSDVEYQVMTPKAFFGTFAEQKWAETKSGFNPMKEDFANTRFIFPLLANN
jgi:hypothetical protein